MNEYHYSPLLFVQKDGTPFEFYMRSCSEKSRLEPLVEKGGALVHSYFRPGRIRLVEPGSTVVNLKENEKAVSVKFIYDCVKNNRLLDMKRYSVQLSTMDTSDFSEGSGSLRLRQSKRSRAELPDDLRSNKVLRRSDKVEVFGPKRTEKIVHFILENEEDFLKLSDLEFSRKLAKSLKQSFVEISRSYELMLISIDSLQISKDLHEKLKILLKKKVDSEFSKDDDLNVLSYIFVFACRESHNIPQSIWEQMKMDGNFTQSAISLWYRFNKFILPNIHNYGLTAFKVQEIIARSELLSSFYRSNVNESSDSSAWDSDRDSVTSDKSDNRKVGLRKSKNQMQEKNGHQQFVHSPRKRHSKDFNKLNNRGNINSNQQVENNKISVTCNSMLNDGTKSLDTNCEINNLLIKNVPETENNSVLHLDKFSSSPTCISETPEAVINMQCMKPQDKVENNISRQQASLESSSDISAVAPTFMQSQTKRTDSQSTEPIVSSSDRTVSLNNALISDSSGFTPSFDNNENRLDCLTDDVITNATGGFVPHLQDDDTLVEQDIEENLHPVISAEPTESVTSKFINKDSNKQEENLLSVGTSPFKAHYLVSEVSADNGLNSAIKRKSARIVKNQNMQKENIKTQILASSVVPEEVPDIFNQNLERQTVELGVNNHPNLASARNPQIHVSSHLDDHENNEHLDIVHNEIESGDSIHGKLDDVPQMISDQSRQTTKSVPVSAKIVSTSLKTTDCGATSSSGVTVSANRQQNRDTICKAILRKSVDQESRLHFHELSNSSVDSNIDDLEGVKRFVTRSLRTERNVQSTNPNVHCQPNEPSTTINTQDEIEMVKEYLNENSDKIEELKKCLMATSTDLDGVRGSSGEQSRLTLDSSENELNVTTVEVSNDLQKNTGSSKLEKVTAKNFHSECAKDFSTPTSDVNDKQDSQANDMEKNLRNGIGFYTPDCSLTRLLDGDSTPDDLDDYEVPLVKEQLDKIMFSEKDKDQAESCSSMSGFTTADEAMKEGPYENVNREISSFLHNHAAPKEIQIPPRSMSPSLVSQNNNIHQEVFAVDANNSINSMEVHPPMSRLESEASSSDIEDDRSPDGIPNQICTTDRNTVIGGSQLEAEEEGSPISQNIDPFGSSGSQQTTGSIAFESHFSSTKRKELLKETASVVKSLNDVLLSVKNTVPRNMTNNLRTKVDMLSDKVCLPLLKMQVKEIAKKKGPISLEEKSILAKYFSLKRKVPYHQFMCDIVNQM